MTDFYRDQYEKYFAETCRMHRLIGGVSAYVIAARGTAAPFPITSEQAIDHIADLLADFDTSFTVQRSGADT